jgi:hypothetical protein
LSPEQHRAAIRSIAVEIHRLGRSKQLPTDAGAREREMFLNIGRLMVLITDLHPSSASALFDIAFALHELEGEPDDDAAPNAKRLS